MALTDITSEAKPIKQLTFMESVQHLLYHPVFAIDLKTKCSGTLNFGGINPAAYTGKLYNVKVDNSTSFWKVPNVTFTVGSLHQTHNVTFGTPPARHPTSYRTNQHLISYPPS